MGEGVFVSHLIYAETNSRPTWVKVYVSRPVMINIVNSLDECLKGCKHITLINKKEHPSVSSEIIHYHKSILFPPMLVYVVGPNKSMCNNSNALDVLIMLFLGCVLPTCFPT